MSGVDDADLDSFNPFAPKIEKVPTSNASPNKPAVLQIDSSDDTPDQKPKVEFKKELSDIEKRTQELDQRARELERREALSSQQQASLNQSKAGRSPSNTDKNWPPLPSCFPCRPFVRVDFDNDFWDETRMMAMFGHYLWMAYFVLLFVNMLGTLSYFIVTENNGYSGGLFGTSILIFIILPIFGFLGWNRTLYKALKIDSSLNFFGFFIMFLIQIILSIIQALGIDYLGSCGWINGLKTWTNTNPGIGAFMIVIATGFTVFTGAAIFLLLKVHSYYRGTGASLSRARQEATTEIGTNIIKQNM